MAAGGGAEPGRALEALLEMGFGARRAAKALALTGNRGVEQAMDWLVAHEDDPDSDSELPPGLGALPLGLGGPRQPPGPEDETQKLLSEAGQERERRRRGQELAKLREWRRDEERRRAAEERRRERAEEWAARQRVREKIERDKAERAQRFAPTPPEPPNPTQEPPREPPAPREHEHCRIQLRLPDGRALTQSFRAREPLAAVRLFVELQGGPGGLGGSGGPPEPFSLRTAFPRRLFTEDDMEKPLQELGLVPSAVVIVAKKEGS
nr:UBX domain-containing protein 1 [Taeniopygia guttata]